MRLGINGRFYGARTTGVQRFAREVCARLYHAVDDVALFLPAGVRPPSGVPASVAVHQGTLPGHAWEAAELAWRARAARRDVVFHPGGTAAPLGGPRAVVVMHDLLPLTRPDAFTLRYRIWHRLALVRPARRAAVLLVPSRWVGAEVERSLAVPAGRIRVVTQGVAPFDSPAPAAAVAAVRARFGLPDRYILALGDGDARKNLPFLYTVIRRWRQRGVEAPPVLVVAGAGARRVHRQAADPTTGERRFAGAAGRGGDEDDAAVLRVGYVEDETLHALYTGATAFCFPSTGEGFGRPPLEAMACGAPAVTADYGPAAEVLGGSAAVLPLDPDAWVDALVELVADPDERLRRAAAGRDHARRFRWETAAEQVLEACRAAAGEGA